MFWKPATAPPATKSANRGDAPHLFLVLGAGVTPAEGSVKPIAGFTFNSYPLNLRATSFAKYVRIKSAPARLIDVSTSIVARSSSIHPLIPAARIIEYSPETL